MDHGAIRRPDRKWAGFIRGLIGYSHGGGFGAVAGGAGGDFSQTKGEALSWVYLSPHFDDVALSCGGLVWEQVQRGEGVNVWTLCGGDLPEGPLSPFAESLHERWKTGREAAAQRRVEDRTSCAAMGASPSYFPIPDCIYRRSDADGAPLYASESAILGPLHPLEARLVEQICCELARRLPQDAQIVAPLALGGHVDHRLVRIAAQGMSRPLRYYADLPYVLTRAEELEKLAEDGWTASVFPVSEAGLTAWQAAIAAHASQISTFWPDLETMEAAISAYCRENQGVRLWQAPD